ncbi:MAG TPA: alpha/beta hydrolase [Polyangiaceae bacterium]
MTTTRQEFVPADAPFVAAIRESARARRGKIFGVGDREPFDKRKSGVQAAASVKAEPGSVGGVPGWWCRPIDGRPDAGLLYLHGGGFLVGSAKAFCNPASHFAQLANVDTFIPDYRLAPENPFPAALDDVVAAYRGLTKQGAKKVVLVGDSAGGGLATTLLVSAAQEGESRICGAVLLSPWVDLSLSGPSMQECAAVDPVFTKDVLAALVGDYLQGHDASDPRASPLFGPLGGLPPIRIDVGEDELLLNDSTRLADAVAAAGGDVTLSIWTGMAHSFHNGVGKLAAANRALDAEGRFLADRLK